MWEFRVQGLRCRGDLKVFWVTCRLPGVNMEIYRGLVFPEWPFEL